MQNQVKRTLVFGSVLLFALAPTALAAKSSEARAVRLPFKSAHRLPDALPGFETLGQATVALYGGRGSWTEGKEHLKSFMGTYRVSYSTLSTRELLDGALDSGMIKLLIMPGGESWKYLEDLGEAGAQKIKTFVEKGGSYIGICAGAFYATSKREGGYASGPYGIGLLDGTAYDGTALETAPYKEGMLDFDFFWAGFAPQYRIVLLGGPGFRYSEQESEAKQIEVLARFKITHDPAMILFKYGSGQVFLSAPHLEIEESRTDWGKGWEDPDSEWPILEKVVRVLSHQR